jgi:hypothetical protein
MFNEYLEKAKAFIAANQTTLIKVGAAIGGALLGAAIAAVVTADGGEEGLEDGIELEVADEDSEDVEDEE